MFKNNISVFTLALFYTSVIVQLFVIQISNNACLSFCLAQSCLSVTNWYTSVDISSAIHNM
jgi:hypothetical protein